MTADEWRACARPQQMLKAAHSLSSDRKLRLAGCAFCRRIWDLLPHDFNRRLVEVIEEHPTGKFEDEVIHTAGVNSSRVEYDYGDNPAYWAVKYLGRSYYKVNPATAAIYISEYVAGRV